MISYSDIQHKLPEEERRRLQKLLWIVLPKHSPPAHLRSMLNEAFKRLGLSIQKLKGKGHWQIFEKLLNSYGVLAKKELNEKEQKILKENPYIICINKESFVLNIDALNYLSYDKNIKNKNYLWLYLQKMSAREKIDWCRWLNINLKFNSERDRTFSLYHYLANLNHKEQKLKTNSNQDIFNEISSTSPLFLNEIFPDNLLISSIAWFYRDAISFYRSLYETEKKLENLTPLARNLISLFKNGSIIIAPVNKAKDQNQRWKIIKTKERHPLNSKLNLFKSLELYLDENRNDACSSKDML